MARSNDIEDVLTSIRRLVAEDAPRTSAGPSNALVLEQARRVSDAEARRVVDPDAPFRSVASLAEPESEPDEADEADVADAEGAADTGPATSAQVTPLLLPKVEELATPLETAPEDPASQPPAAEAEDPEIDLADLGRSSADDEALRRVIEEVVRQELSGALGERITRNVRKLVRRELRRVLSDDGFD